MTKQKQTKKNTLPLLLRSITGIALIAVAGVLVMIYGAHGSQDTLTMGVMSLMAIIAFYSAIMIYALFVGAIAKNTSKKLTKKEDDRVLIEWLILVAGVVVVMAIALIPALAMGIFTTDNTSAGQATALLYLMIFIGLLFGPLIAAGIFAPIRLLIGGTVALLRGDRSKVSQIRLGGAITALTVFCLTTGFAIHPYFSGIGGWALVILGLLGIPGAYEVKDEALLWVARVVLVVIIVALIASAGRKKASNK